MPRKSKASAEKSKGAATSEIVPNEAKDQKGSGKRKRKSGFRDRVLGLQSIPKEKIVPDPLNPKVHTARQRAALTAVMQEIGFAGALLVRKLDGNSYALIDGHERLEHFEAGAMVRCLVTDLNGEEARKLLAVYDPIGALAQVDVAKLDELKASIKFDSKDLDDLVASVLANVPLPAVESPTANSIKIPAAGDETAAAPAAAKAEEPTPPQNGAAVVVTCRDKTERRKLVLKLRKAGYHCKTTD